MRCVLLIGCLIFTVSATSQSLNRKYLGDRHIDGAGEVYQTLIFEDDLWFVDETGQVCFFDGLNKTCYGNEELDMPGIYKFLFSGYDRIHVYDVAAQKYGSYIEGVWQFHDDQSANLDLGPNNIFQDSTKVWYRYFWTGDSFEKLDQRIINDLIQDSLTQPIDICIRDCNIYTINQSDRKTIVTKPGSPLDGAVYLGRNFFQTTSGDFAFLDHSCSIRYTEAPFDFLIKSNLCHSEPSIAIKKNGIEVFSFDKNKVVARLKDDILAQYERNDHYYLTASHNGLAFNSHGIQFFEGGVENMVSASHTVNEDDQGHIWFGGYQTGLAKYDWSHITKHPLKNSRLDNVMHGSINMDGSLIILTEQYNQLIVIKNGKVQTKSVKSNKPFLAYDVKELNNGLLAFGTLRNGVGLVKKDRLFIDSIQLIHEEQGIQLKQIFKVAQDSNHRIWMASQTEGLAVYDIKTGQGHSFLISEDKENRFGITTLLHDDQDNLWLGTFDGLKIIRQVSSLDINQDDPFSQMEDVNLFPEEGNTTALIQKDNYLVVAAENDVWFIDLIEFYQDPTFFSAYSYSYAYDLQGRTSEENGALVDSKGQIWIGTQEGYLCFNLDQMSFDTTAIDVYIDRYEIADSSYTLEGDVLRLPASNRNLTYHYNIKHNPSLRQNFYIKSQLIDSRAKVVLEDTYDPFKKSNRLFLEAGHYTLRTSVYKNNRLVDQDQYTLIAESYLIEKPWFWPLIISLLSVAFILFIRFRNEKIKSLMQKDLDLQKLKQQQNQARIQGIVSSFNPHFINNSLHWVQSKYNQDPELVKVTGRLSENMEHILLKSKAGVAHHTLREELKLVRNYITIQRIRFHDSFAYQENGIHENLLDLKLPIMQLQIHVENAVEHGLSNRLASSYISLTIEESDTDLIFIIEDDGCGRAKAKEIGSRGTQAGLDMLANLHTMINNQNQQKIRQSYEDNCFGDFGTRVIIHIPKQMTYEI